MSNKQWFLKRGINNHFLSREITTIGRKSSNHIQIKSQLVSRNQCSIELDGNIPVLHNHSQYATKINGKTVQRAKVLQAEDIISFGNNEKFTLKKTEDLKPAAIMEISDESENEIITVSDMSSKPAKEKKRPISPSFSEIKRLRTADWVDKKSSSPPLTPYSNYLENEKNSPIPSKSPNEQWSPISSTESEFYYGPNKYITENENYRNQITKSEEEKTMRNEPDQSNQKTKFKSITLKEKFESNKWDLKNKKINIMKPNTKINNCKTQ